LTIDVSGCALGLAHSTTAACLTKLTFLVRAQGDLVASRFYLKRVLATAERALGPDHPTVQVARRNLAR
jgi:hypothetical protein